MTDNNSIEHYMQVPLGSDHGEGFYRVFPLAWTVETAKDATSKAVGIAIRYGVYQRWDATERRWSDEWPPGYFVESRSWVVKKDGEVNSGAIENLSKCGLWDGDWDKLSGPCPTGMVVIVDVKAETYEGKTRYRAAWINPNAEEPQARGGFAPVDTNLLSSLRMKFGSKTRAAAGGARTGSPGAPPPMQQPVAQPQPIGQPQPQPMMTPAPQPQAQPMPQAQPRPPQFAPNPGPRPAVAAPSMQPPRPQQFAPQHAAPQPMMPPAAPAPGAQSPYAEAFGDPAPEDVGPVPFM